VQLLQYLEKENTDSTNWELMDSHTVNTALATKTMQFSSYAIANTAWFKSKKATDNMKFAHTTWMDIEMTEIKVKCQRCGYDEFNAILKTGDNSKITLACSSASCTASITFKTGGRKQ
jgi:hypothetical protein